MTGLKFIICALLTAILVIGSDIKTTPAQIKRDKISFNEAFSQNIFKNTDNPQLTQLDSALYTVSEDKKRERIGSYILLGIGSTFIIGGLAVLNPPNKSQSESFGQGIVGVLLILIGAPMIPVGLYARLQSSGIEEYYVEFRDIPEATPDEAERKLKTGELMFEKFTRSAKQKRQIGSAIIVAFFSSVIALESDLALFSIFWIGKGTWNYFSKSKLEKAYDNYIAEKEIYSSTDVGNNLSWKMFPLPGKGVGGVVSLEF